MSALCECHSHRFHHCSIFTVSPAYQQMRIIYMSLYKLRKLNEQSLTMNK